MNEPEMDEFGTAVYEAVRSSMPEYLIDRNRYASRAVQLIRERLLVSDFFDVFEEKVRDALLFRQRVQGSGIPTSPETQAYEARQALSELLRTTLVHQRGRR